MNDLQLFSPPERMARMKESGHPVSEYQETLLKEEHAIAKGICAMSRGGTPCEDVERSLLTMCQTCIAKFRANFRARH